MKHGLTFHKYVIDIPTSNGRNRIYKYNDILYIVANRPYAKIHCIDKTNYLVNFSLVALEKILPDIFFRCAYSTIINLSHIKEYSLSEQNAVMADDSVIQISHRHIKGFIEAIDSLNRLISPFHCCTQCEEEDRCCKSFCAKLPEKPK
jgi:DNA-binding LytR/AlgR family response regulator